ncbi:MAG: hypothetical protein OEZ36_00850 [Spirochaetota bacterium]|nr:hypothetical protein [Spirochaetota bacterium]
MKKVLLIDLPYYPHNHLSLASKSPEFFSDDKSDYHLIRATSPGEALEKAAVEQPDLIILNGGGGLNPIQNMTNDFKSYRLTRNIPLITISRNYYSGELHLNTKWGLEPLKNPDHSWITQAFINYITRKIA